LETVTEDDFEPKETATKEEKHYDPLDEIEETPPGVPINHDVHTSDVHTASARDKDIL